MRLRGSGRGNFAAAILVLAWLGGPARAQHSGHTGATEPQRMYGEKLQVGADGAFTFSAPTLIGDLLYKAGRYRLDHAVEGEDHFVTLTNVERPAEQEQAQGRVKCRVEPLKKPAKKSELFVIVRGGLRTVEKVQFQGEAVKHVF